MKKLLLISILVIVWEFILFLPTIISSESNSSPLDHIMGEEYKDMSKLRQKLRELLERQKLSEVFQETNDAYTSFQNLEQWLERLESTPENDQLKQFTAMLKEFEKHMRDVLMKQQRVSEQYSSSLMNPENTRNMIPLSQIMDQLRDLIKDGKINEGRELLDQMLALFSQQQNQLQQSVNQYNQEKFSGMKKQLNKIDQKVTKAIGVEEKVRSMLTRMNEGPLGNKNQQIGDQQNLVTQLTQEMLILSEEILTLPLVSLEDIKSWIQQSKKKSQDTESLVQTDKNVEAGESARYTQVYLQKIRQNSSKLQQQMQQLSQPQKKSVRTGQRYISDKGVRLPKFDYEFQVNPAYRKDIQQLNQENYPQITPRQQKYLYDVIR